ncbi:MAG: hypothetical protein V7L11_13645 [Nostoc sp.]|uniref:hypothetical protein n=1 Tax=Nostoc sp. TaxID=1180 RepID=UPI002FFB1EA1
MNLTEIKPADIITHIEQNFNRSQATGLNSLIFLALREDTSVAYQWRSWGFEDIPKQVIDWCGCMDEHDLIELALSITNCLYDEILPAAVELKNAQAVDVQAIEEQFQPTLLSDY